ncbi:MAG: hypothetical protein LBJ60_03015, partial [Tannerellaceae bacterium]|nr:hypothetical protein [Tannerellaceae bacterium]
MDNKINIIKGTSTTIQYGKDFGDEIKCAKSSFRIGKLGDRVALIYLDGKLAFTSGLGDITIQEDRNSAQVQLTAANWNSETDGLNDKTGGAGGEEMEELDERISKVEDGENTIPLFDEASDVSLPGSGTVVGTFQRIRNNLKWLMEKAAEPASSITSALTEAKGYTDSAAVGRSELVRALTGVSYAANGTNVTGTYDTYNASTKTAGTMTITLPLVSADKAGAATKEMYSALEGALTGIAALQQQGGRFIGVSFATKANLDAYTIPATVNVGDFTYVLDDETKNDATTRYIVTGTPEAKALEYAYTINYDPVGLATAMEAGLVLGTA